MSDLHNSRASVGGARDTANCPRGPRQPLVANSFLTQNVKSTKVEKSCYGSTVSCVPHIRNNLLNVLKNRSKAVRKKDRAWTISLGVESELCLKLPPTT